MRESERARLFTVLADALEGAGHDVRFLTNGLRLMASPYLVLWTGDRFDLRRVLDGGPPYDERVGTAATAADLLTLLTATTSAAVILPYVVDVMRCPGGECEHERCDELGETPHPTIEAAEAAAATLTADDHTLVARVYTVDTISGDAQYMVNAFVAGIELAITE